MEENQENDIMTLEDALRKQIKTSLMHDSLARGLREVVKSIEDNSAKIVLLAKDCKSKEYCQLIKALCKSRKKPLIEIETRNKIGEWVGLGKIDSEGKIVKVVGCSSCAIKDWLNETETKSIIENSLIES